MTLFKAIEVSSDKDADYECNDCGKQLTIYTAIADVENCYDCIEYAADYCLECAKKKGYVEKDVKA